jgi:hypothetical protein
MKLPEREGKGRKLKDCEIISFLGLYSLPVTDDPEDRQCGRDYLFPVLHDSTD